MFAYCITNKINNKKYIGITSKTVEQRYLKHLNKASHGSMYAIHCAIRKYGQDAFEIKQIGQCLTWDSLCKMETKLIEKYNTFVPNGYNMTTGGEGIPGIHKPISQETIEKIRISLIGHNVSKETREKIGNAHRGKKLTYEQIEKIKSVHIGRKTSEETKEKMRLSSANRKHTPESKAKMSLIAKNREYHNLLDPQTKQKRIQALKNKAILIEINGISKTYPEWSAELGISYNTLSRRYKKGLRGDKLIAPPAKTGPYKK